MSSETSYVKCIKYTNFSQLTPNYLFNMNYACVKKVILDWHGKKVRNVEYVTWEAKQIQDWGCCTSRRAIITIEVIGHLIVGPVHAVNPFSGRINTQSRVAAAERHCRRWRPQKRSPPERVTSNLLVHVQRRTLSLTDIRLLESVAANIHFNDLSLPYLATCKAHCLNHKYSNCKGETRFDSTRRHLHPLQLSAISVITSNYLSPCSTTGIGRFSWEPFGRTVRRGVSGTGCTDPSQNKPRPVLERGGKRVGEGARRAESPPLRQILRQVNSPSCWVRFPISGFVTIKYFWAIILSIEVAGGAFRAAEPSPITQKCER